MLGLLSGCANNDTPADNAENSKAAETAENFTDEMKIPYAVDLSPEDGADSVERSCDHENSPYFAHPDVYNMESTDTLTVLTHFRTMQQTSEWSCGVTAALFDAGIRPDYVAGLSLGEYSALEASGVFAAKAAIELAAYRGAAMASASKGVSSAMTAVLMLDRESLARCCEEAGGMVRICNYNCPGQIVIGGEADAVARAGELAKAAGARRLLPLRVSGPFHTPLMQPAAKALHERFKTEPFGEMQIPVLFNCLGQEKGSETIPSLLERQVVSPVMMEDTLRELARLGVDTFVEIGPGTALSGFVRKTLGASVNCYNIENVDGLEKTVDALKA